MASQSLYRKWRSQTFSDLVGQEPIIQTLKNALHEGTLAHAYLFTGPRGTGKTSTARLLAKTINCPNTKDGEPCNTCEQCRQITIGNSFNVIEIDAASNRGIDSIRDLREKVMMPPTTGKYKVYILDEAHMLTTEAFNALLKTLEEPPPHAIFVMATTDVHKMLPTVLSRCQRFDFKRITTQQIVKHLDYIAKQEHVELETSAAALIARAAAGGMRDALSLLDQAIAYAGQHVTLPQVQAMLGVADPRAIQKFIFHIAQLDSAGGLHLINELVEAGADLYQVNKQVAEFWRAMMLTKAGADIAAIIDGTVEEVKEIQQTSDLFALEELTECARVFAQNELVQKNQGTPQLGLELALLSAIALHRRTQNGQSATPSLSIVPPRETNVGVRFTAPTMPAAQSSAPLAAQSPAPTVPQLAISIPPVVPPVPVVVAKPVRGLQEETVGKDTDELPDWENLSYADEEEEAALAPVPQAVAPVEPIMVSDGVDPEPDDVIADEEVQPALTVEDVKERWEYIKRRVRSKKNGARIAALLNGCHIIRIEGSEALPVVIIVANAEFHFTALQKKEDQDLIIWALKIELERECGMRLLPPGGAAGAIIVPPVIPPAAPPQTSNRAASSAPPSSPTRSAHLERPPAQIGTVPQRPENRRTEPLQKQERPPASNPSGPIPLHGQASALARNPIVRENSNSMSPDGEDASPLEKKENVTTRLEFVAKKAKHDPVVQEVVRMFKADIKDVHLK
jgi:DNA polymerase III subunit gamma/tau